jgi:two-component system, OmpR family, sensor histidine kinase VanS
MKPSIRLKLFGTLCCLIAAFVLLSLTLNGLFLEKFYLRTKEAVLREGFDLISENFNGDITSILLELERFENEKGLQIIIIDENFDNIYNPRFDFRRLPPNAGGRFDNRMHERQIVDNLRKFSPAPRIEKREDKRLNSLFLSLYGTKSINGRTIYILMSTSVAAISDSATIANRFFMVTGAIILVIGGIIIFFISKKFTDPILEINQITKDMSVLDFSRKIKINSKDEFGQLAESINYLSNQLEKSISSLREANRQLQKDIAQKDEIDRMRKEFISNISHELKTPLAIILGYSEGLRLNISRDDKDFYCDVITDEAQRMSKLVFRLLDLSQLESGAIDIEKSDFSISELVDQCLERSSILFKEKDVTVTVNSEDGLMVTADYERIEQMFTNYLTNAINHVDDRKIIRINICSLESKARISIFNSGSHIPEESLDKIWDSFYKVDKARTRTYGGTGIGLYIVKTIMELHQNRYGVNNIEGGVEFWFELDLCEEKG